MVERSQERGGAGCRRHELSKGDLAVSPRGGVIERKAVGGHDQCLAGHARDVHGDKRAYQLHAIGA